MGALTEIALKFRWLVILAAVAIIAAGGAAYTRLNVEAYPNPVPPMIDVITQPEGLSAAEVERYVTVPLEVSLAGMPGLEHVRSQSLFGLSDVKCYFNWDTKYGDARQEVLNRLQMVELPLGLQPKISPANAIGELVRYKVEGKGYSMMDLKAAQDWTLERQFRLTPGVADVVGFGGETKQYHVAVDPFRLRGQGVTLSDLTQAIQNANKNVGGQRIVIGEQAYAVRGVGLLRNLHDVDDIVISENKGVPVRVRDVANAQIGGAPRLGIVGQDDDPDIVQGIVLMRYGGQTASTLEGIHARVKDIEQSHALPPGMKIAPYYDRGELVKLTTKTVLENLAVGMGLVVIVLLVFLGNVRAALMTAINIPLALLVACLGLVSTGTSANLISLGAIDFGIVVDSTVIMMESVFHQLAKSGTDSIEERIRHGARAVSRPMAFSTLILGVAFLPLFTMHGVAGVIFTPMAITYALAIGGAIAFALTLTPALAYVGLRPKGEEKPSVAMRALAAAFHPLVAAGAKWPKRVLIMSLVPIVLGLASWGALGREFMPKLEEGNLWIRVQLPMSISLDQSAQYVGRMRAIVRGCDGVSCGNAAHKHPQVITVVSQLGRPDDGTDVAGFNNVELFAPLKPFDEWPKGETKDALVETLSRDLADAFPGATFNFSQMIADNVEEAVSGVKGENSVKVIGPDLKTDESLADQVVDVLRTVPGVHDVGLIRSLGQPTIKVEPDRIACARYGLNTGDVEAVIQAAIGGEAVTQVFESEKRFDLTVRWLEPYRSSLEAIREITVPTKANVNVPLGQIASIGITDGPSVIFREASQRYVAVKFSVRGRDLAGTVADAQTRVANEVRLPYDVHLAWAGEADELHESERRLRIVLPVTLLLVGLLVYLAVRRWRDMIVVFANVPVALAGGVLALLVTHVHFSVSAAMGFVSVLGIAIQDALLVVNYYASHRSDGAPAPEAAMRAAEKCLRPSLMATLVAMIGLLPAATSNGIGAQTQKPLAVVVIGGCLLIALLAKAVQVPLLTLLARSEKDPSKEPRTT